MVLKGIILLCALSGHVAAQVLEANPAVIFPGLTKNLTIACYVQPGSVSQMARLFSLLISHAAEPDKQDSKYLVSVNALNGKFDEVSLGTATASGAVNSGGVSYLKVSWTDPKSINGGLYKCDANGISSMGKPMAVSGSVSVISEKPNVDNLVDEIRNQTESLHKLKNYFDNLAREVQRLESLFGQHLIFKISDVFQGRRYFLSEVVYHYNRDAANDLCIFNGGYLVELDTEEEFQFIQKFLQPFNKDYLVVLTGATYAIKENKWVNFHSKTPVKYIKWAPGEPNSGHGENCLSLWSEYGWSLADHLCMAYNADHKIGFLCEIPNDVNT